MINIYMYRFQLSVHLCVYPSSLIQVLLLLRHLGHHAMRTSMKASMAALPVVGGLRDGDAVSDHDANSQTLLQG